MANPMYDYDAAPSKLTAPERAELARLMNKLYWTADEKSRVSELKRKAGR